jgi:hypothetical protein
VIQLRKAFLGRVHAAPDFLPVPEWTACTPKYCNLLDKSFSGSTAAPDWTPHEQVCSKRDRPAASQDCRVLLMDVIFWYTCINHVTGCAQMATHFVYTTTHLCTLLISSATAQPFHSPLFFCSHINYSANQNSPGADSWFSNLKEAFWHSIAYTLSIDVFVLSSTSARIVLVAYCFMVSLPSYLNTFFRAKTLVPASNLLFEKSMSDLKKPGHAHFCHSGVCSVKRF